MKVTIIKNHNKVSNLNFTIIFKPAIWACWAHFHNPSLNVIWELAIEYRIRSTGRLKQNSCTTLIDAARPGV